MHKPTLALRIYTSVVHFKTRPPFSLGIDVGHYTFMARSYDMAVPVFHEALETKSFTKGRGLSIEVLAQALAIIHTYHLKVET